MSSTNSLHHVTATCSDEERTIDFYTRGLGLKLIRRTVNYDNIAVLQLYCGDAVGSPGSIISFLVEPGAPVGLAGTGQIGNIVFSIEPGTYDYWVERLGSMGVSVQGYAWSFGEQHLCFSDPDGLSLSLVAVHGVPKQPADEKIVGPLRSIELQLQGFELTSRFLVDVLGFEQMDREGPVTRLVKGPSTTPAIVDLVSAPSYRGGRDGIGLCHHAAWRVQDEAALLDLRKKVVAAGVDATPMLDRLYFHAIYFKIPGGVRVGVATDVPGFGRSPPESDGLELPQWLENKRGRIEKRLAQRS